MIEECSIDKSTFHFILIRENKIAAFIQRGNNESHILVNITRFGEPGPIREEIESTLLSEPWSKIMESMGNWEYMKDQCYKSANLYGKFIWAYYDPKYKEYQCGFGVSFVDS